MPALKLIVARSTGVDNIDVVYAKEKGITLPGPQGGRGPQGGPGPRRDGNADRPALFTPEERQANREKMRAAKTPEERAELRRQMREQAEQRAREKGITLPPERRPAGPPKSPSTGN